MFQPAPAHATQLSMGPMSQVCIVVYAQHASFPPFQQLVRHNMREGRDASSLAEAVRRVNSRLNGRCRGETMNGNI